MARKISALIRIVMATTAATATLALGACSLFRPPEALTPEEVPTRSPATTTSPNSQAAQPHAAPRPRVPPAAPATAAAAVPTPTLPAAPPQETSPPPSREYRLGPAAQSLVNQAHAQTARGELPGASTTLDRALRIEPQNPLLWTELARLRLLEGDARQAEACARKALALGSLDPSVRTQAGHVLLEAFKAQHKTQDARELEAQPWMS